MFLSLQFFRYVSKRSTKLSPSALTAQRRRNGDQLYQGKPCLKVTIGFLSRWIQSSPDKKGICSYLTIKVVNFYKGNCNDCLKTGGQTLKEARGSSQYQYTATYNLLLFQISTSHHGEQSCDDGLHLLSYKKKKRVLVHNL